MEHTPCSLWSGRRQGVADTAREAPQDLMQAACVLRLAFPDHLHRKPPRLENCVRCAVPLTVPGELREPELSVALRRRCPGTSRVSVPIAAMYEDRPPPAAIGEIGGTGQVPVLRPIPHTELRARPSNPQLRRRAGLANAPHPPGNVVGRSQARRVPHKARLYLLEGPVLQCLWVEQVRKPALVQRLNAANHLVIVKDIGRWGGRRASYQSGG